MHTSETKCTNGHLNNRKFNICAIVFVCVSVLILEYVFMPLYGHILAIACTAVIGYCKDDPKVSLTFKAMFVVFFK